MIARNVFFEGRVQGVGFRYTVRNLARGFEVAGWVRNLDDGRVELLAAGEPDEVEAFLAAIAESELAGLIKNTQARPAAPGALEGVRGFSILH